MADRDRLEELLARATQERRGEPGAGVPLAGEREPGEHEVEEGTTREREVSGGEWLPPDPGRHRRPRAGPPVLALPESLRAVDLRVRPTAVIALCVVALVAAGVFGWRWWRAEQGSTPVPVPPAAADRSPVQVDDAVATSAGGPTGPAGDPVGQQAADPAPPSELVVHVAGEVPTPGVVRLKVGARVQDALDAAGGLGADADTSRVNLARAVVDGERIWVPRPGEEVPEVVESPAQPDGLGAAPPAAGGAGQGQINLNTADQAVLEELPGVGPVTASAIVQWRTDNGRFSSPDELLEVSGIGEATLEKLRPHITL